MGKKEVEIFETIMLPLQRLPIGFHYFMGKIFIWFVKNCIRYRRDVVMVNLSRSFPEKKYDELIELSNRFYAHIGNVFAETFWFGGCRNNPQKLHEEHLCEIVNIDELYNSYNNSPSVMILTSHYGNWEIMGGLFQYIYEEPEIKSSMSPKDICVVYRKLHNSFWDEFLGHNRISQFPETTGYLESMEVLRYAVTHRNEKKVYIFPTDQFPYGAANKCEIPSFMNQKTYAMTGAATLANKFGLSVLYMSIEKSEDKGYKIEFKKICNDASTMDAQTIMEKYYSLLEQEIKNRPENYLWSHKRWK